MNKKEEMIEYLVLTNTRLIRGCHWKEMLTTKKLLMQDKRIESLVEINKRLIAEINQADIRFFKKQQNRRPATSGGPILNGNQMEYFDDNITVNI